MAPATNPAPGPPQPRPPHRTVSTLDGAALRKASPPAAGIAEAAPAHATMPAATSAVAASVSLDFDMLVSPSRFWHCPVGGEGTPAGRSLDEGHANQIAGMWPFKSPRASSRSSAP